MSYLKVRVNKYLQWSQWDKKINTILRDEENIWTQYGCVKSTFVIKDSPCHLVSLNHLFVPIQSENRMNYASTMLDWIINMNTPHILHKNLANSKLLQLILIQEIFYTYQHLSWTIQVLIRILFLFQKENLFNPMDN